MAGAIIHDFSLKLPFIKTIILMKGIDVYPIKYGFLIHSNRSVFSFKVNF